MRDSSNSFGNTLAVTFVARIGMGRVAFVASIARSKRDDVPVWTLKPLSELHALLRGTKTVTQNHSHVPSNTNWNANGLVTCLVLVPPF